MVNPFTTPTTRQSRFGEWRGALGKRLALMGRPAPVRARGPQIGLLLGELAAGAEPLRRKFRAPLDIQPATHRRIVMIMPGFCTHPLRMRYLARQLERAGHKTKHWGLGWNWGPSEQNFAALAERLDAVHARYDQKIVLLGWSLGGIFAREVAKHRPDKVSLVISMGSPFSGAPNANNAWRLYELITGHAVDSPPIEAHTAIKPPVETVAMWSPRDGVISPRSAAGREGERDRVVALRCTHLGFSYAPDAIQAVLQELDRP